MGSAVVEDDDIRHCWSVDSRFHCHKAHADVLRIAPRRLFGLAAHPLIRCRPHHTLRTLTFRRFGAARECMRKGLHRIDPIAH